MKESDVRSVTTIYNSMKQNTKKVSHWFLCATIAKSSLAFVLENLN